MAFVTGIDPSELIKRRDAARQDPEAFRGLKAARLSKIATRYNLGNEYAMQIDFRRDAV